MKDGPARCTTVAKLQRPDSPACQSCSLEAQQVATKSVFTHVRAGVQGCADGCGHGSVGGWVVSMYSTHVQPPPAWKHGIAHGSAAAAFRFPLVAQIKCVCPFRESLRDDDVVQSAAVHGSPLIRSDQTWGPHPVLIPTQTNNCSCLLPVSCRGASGDLRGKYCSAIVAGDGSIFAPPYNARKASRQSRHKAAWHAVVVLAMQILRIDGTGNVSPTLRLSDRV